MSDNEFKKTIANGIRSEYKKRSMGNVMIDSMKINNMVETIGARHKEGEKSNNFLVSLVPNGRRFILYCTNRYNNIPSCFLISLRSCYKIVDGPDLDGISCDDLEIIPVKYRFSLPLFNGSILEGILLGTKFIITDTPFLAGKHLNSTTLDSRVEEIKYLLEKHYVDDSYISEYQLSVLNYYQNTYTHRRTLINELKSLDSSPSDLVVQGKLMYTSLLYNGEIIID